MAEIRGRVMTIPHYCYDEGDDLPQFLIGKIAGNGNRNRLANFVNSRNLDTSLRQSAR
jgi:hypothetical protein